MNRIIIIALLFANAINAQNKHIKIPIPVVAGGGGTGTVTSISATAPTEGFTIGGSPITNAGTFVFTLSHDLNGLESLSGTGIAVRTGANAWTTIPLTSIDTSFTNEIQVLSLVGSTLYLSNGGGSVVLPGGGGGSQTLDTFEIVSNILRASLSGDGQPYKSVSLANYLQTLSFNSGTGQLTISNGNTVTITAGGGSSTDLAFSSLAGGITLQSSSGGDVVWMAGTGISITQSGGLTATITNTAPNVNQTLSIVGTTLSISSGNSVTIPGGTVAGSGSTNFIPIWTGANSLGNSLLLFNGSNGFNLGTGTAGAYKLYFGDAQYVFVGEGSTDDRLHLRGSTMSVEIGTGNFGSNGQALVSNGTTLSYTTVDLSNTNELQTISLAGNVLTLSNGGGSVSLPSGGGGTITDLTVTQSGANAILNSSDGLDVTLVAGSGVGLTVNTAQQMTLSFSEVDGSITNEAQTISRSGNTITLTTAGGAGGGTVSVSDLVNVTYTGGTGISVSGSTITNTSLNTDNQNLSLSGQSLSITSGTGVTLPVINVSGGTGISVNTSSGNFTVTNTGDLSATNEAQSLSIAGSIITLSSVSGVGGGSVTLPAATLNNLTTYQVGETAQRTLFTNSDGTMITFAGSGEFISGYWVYQSFSVESDLLVAYAAFSGSGYIPSYFDSNGSITRPSGYVVGNGGTLLSDAVVVQGIGNFTLPTGVSGKVVYITNTTGSSITISAPSGGSINGLGSYALGANKGAVVFYLSNTVTGIATN